MTKASRNKKDSNAVFDTMRLLERARIHFYIMRNRPDSLTLVAMIVGERIEIDIFEDDHIEIARFRGDESIEGERELLVDIVDSQLRENYPEEVGDAAAK